MDFVFHLKEAIAKKKVLKVTDCGHEHEEAEEYHDRGRQNTLGKGLFEKIRVDWQLSTWVCVLSFICGSQDSVFVLLIDSFSQSCIYFASASWPNLLDYELSKSKNYVLLDPLK